MSATESFCKAQRFMKENPNNTFLGCKHNSKELENAVVALCPLKKEIR